MKKRYDRRIVVIVRETRLKTVLESLNTLSQAKFYINSLGGDFDEYEAEHRQYNASVQKARQSMEGLGNLQILDRKYLPNFIFAPDDLVVVIGQDGLVANTIKYLDGQPVIGVNPDAARWDGVLLPFTPGDTAKILRETLAGRRKAREVSMARARLQNGQELLAVNDFFIGQRTHVSARYIIKHGGLKEPQSSSGVIVSTGLGSTGWMKSVLAGAARISTAVTGARQEQENLVEKDADHRAAAPREPKPADFLEKRVGDESPAFSSRDWQKRKTHGVSGLFGVLGKWDSRELIFAVREPFPSKTTGAHLVFGKVSADAPLKIESLMGENGVIFSDGMESDFLAFNSGAEAVITLAEKRGHIVV